MLPLSDTAALLEGDVALEDLLQVVLVQQSWVMLASSVSGSVDLQ